MDLKTLSHQDTVELLEIINDSLSCESESELKSLMSRLGQLLPYEAQLATIANLDPLGRVDGLRIVNIDYPPAYLAELANRNLISKDPIVAENFRHFRLQYWDDTFRQDGRDGAFSEIVSLAEDFGFRGVAKGIGYGHGVRSRRGNRGSFFSWHGLQRSQRTETILNIIVPHLHEVLNRLDLPGERMVIPPKTNGAQK